MMCLEKKKRSHFTEMEPIDEKGVRSHLSIDTVLGCGCMVSGDTVVDTVVGGQVVVTVVVMVGIVVVCDVVVCVVGKEVVARIVVVVGIVRGVVSTVYGRAVVVTRNG